MKIRSFTLLLACVGTWASAQPATLPYELQADEVLYSEQGTTLTAQGMVEITNGEETLKADKVIYNQEQDTVTASGNVLYFDGSGQVITVDTMTLSGDLKQAALTRMALRVEGMGEILTAGTGNMQDDTYTLQDVAYSPCPKCADEPQAWRFRADDVTFDSKNNEVRYKNAILDVYGVPVAYLPYFRHPIERDKPKSGLLFPQLGRSTNLGEEVTLGYYYIQPESNTDYTVRTRFMSDRGLMGMLEQRHEGLTSSTEIRTSFIEDDRRNTFRGNAKVIAEYRLQPGRRLGINAETSSDDTYLQDFFNRTDNYLPATLYGEDASQKHYFGIHATWYQDLETDRDPALTAQVLPQIQFERLWNLDDAGTQFIINADAQALYRSKGARSRRMVGSAQVIRPWLLQGGHRLTASGKLRGDLYNVDETAQDGNTFRFLTEASLLWERPMVSSDGQHIATPMAMFVLSPRGGNPEDIPNEDSVAYELDASNLFSTNRFAGLDRVENGPRLIYGLDNRWGSAARSKWRLFVGQSWRFVDDDDLPALGGTFTKISDWVGFLEANPADWFSLNTLFRLDNSNFNPRRLDSNFRLGRKKGTNLSVTHTFLDGGPEELTAELKVPLSDEWRFSALTRRDLADNNRQLESRIALDYIQSCYQISFITRRRGFRTADLEPSTDYLINFNLFTFGRPKN
jgi:LPS-assembly protein